MKEIIKIDLNSCVGCNRCVRECPMEMANITYQDEAGNIKVKIDYEKCIKCGRCVSACKHKARFYEDDTERFFNDLFSGVSISLIVAPSIKTNMPDYKRLFTYLKRLGVKKIYDVSLGADICIWAHVRHIEKTNSVPLITQPCPVIVSYCEIYQHDLLKRLSPIQSPMGCIAIYMKEYEGINDKIAALSPCIAKSLEFENTKLAQYNVTFAKLLEYIDKHNIILPNEETEFDHYNSGLGSLFPMPGGLKENIEFYFDKNLHISRAEGFTVYDKLSVYAKTPNNLLPEIFDVLNCIEGCNIGSASSHDKTIFEIENTMKNSRKEATQDRDKEYFKSLYKIYDDTFDLPHFMIKYNPIHTTHSNINNEDVDKAFMLLNKMDYEKQNIDCGACGSQTCHDMARKIALNVNIPINCIVNAMETAKKEHEQMLVAEQVSHAKSNFLSKMSHEMRTPMNSIIGMAEIADTTDDTQKLKYCLSVIDNSSKHLLGLINDILDMSKIEADKLELMHEPLNIEKILMNVCNLIIEKVENKNIKFGLFIDPSMNLDFMGDNLRLSQIIANILSNAVKFTPKKGEIKLTVKEIKNEENYSILEFTIADNGIGMTKEQIQKLFKPFEQADSNIASKFGGTGLGLAISKNLIENMGGSIHVESEFGKGSRFTFDVKLDRLEQQSSIVLYDKTHFSNLHILVIDGDEDSRRYFKSIADTHGIDIDIIESNNNVINIIEKNSPYDIIFIDYNPTDIEAIKSIKNLHNSVDKNTVIIIMTSFLNWNKIENDVRNMGIERFISKPLFSSEILSVINDVVGGVETKLDVKKEIHDFSNITLLLAEDVDINREIFITLLEDTKIKIDIAENGKIAVQKFKDNPTKYNMIIMDIQMPEMNGYEATQEIRALDIEEAKSIPIVAITANAFKEDIDQCIASGMNDHLPKPIDVDAVIEKIALYSKITVNS